MDKLAVISQVTEIDKFRIAEESLKKYGLDYFIYGIGTSWWSWAEKVRITCKAIKELSDKYTHIMWVDAFDSIYLTGEDEIMEKYRKLGSNIVFSAEQHCWPDESKAAKYVHKSNSNWKYLNAGGYIGERELFRKVLEEHNGEKCDENDMLYWADIYLSNQYSITLDTECEIYQCMSHCYNEWFDVVEGRVRNLKTGMNPCVLHFNGRTDPKRYKELFENKEGL